MRNTRIIICCGNFSILGGSPENSVEVETRGQHYWYVVTLLSLRVTTSFTTKKDEHVKL